MTEICRTESICPVCLNVLPAKNVELENRVFLRKDCPEHGPCETLIASDADWYRRVMAFSPVLRKPIAPLAATEKGCPMDCGLCPSHLQRMYLPVVPITSACNMNCPVCYTINKNRNAYFMTRDEFSGILDQIRENDPEMRIINFTGGEPLMHPEFREMAKMCRDVGIRRITVSTNGLRFLEDETLLPDLTALDARIVLSFNSFESGPYIATAGRDLLGEKLKILELLDRHRPSTTLLTVVASGVNDGEIGDIVRHVINGDHIVSSEIHTVAFTGQGAGGFDRAARTTIPDVIAGIAKSNPDIRPEHFLPSPCAHPLCYATCYLLKLDNGDAVPFPDFMPEQEVLRMLSGSLYMEPGMATEEILTDVMNDIWSLPEPAEQDRRILRALRELLDGMFPRGGSSGEIQRKIAENATKAIYIHSHMDAENFDLARIRACCVAVPDGRGDAIPTCAYNTIYRARDLRFNSNG